MSSLQRTAIMRPQLAGKCFYERRSNDHAVYGTISLPHDARLYVGQFPTALRGDGHVFGESFGRIFVGVIAPFMVEPYTGPAVIFFSTIVLVVMTGACVPLLFGKETVGQLEVVIDLVPELACGAKKLMAGTSPAMTATRIS